MSSRDFAVLFMIAVMFLVILVDVVLALNDDRGDTFSAVLRRAGRENIAIIMLITFSMGLLAGHWWW